MMQIKFVPRHPGGRERNKRPRNPQPPSGIRIPGLRQVAQPGDRALPNKKPLQFSLKESFFSLKESFSPRSNAPSRNSSPSSVSAAVLTSVNAAFGNCSQTAISSSSAVRVSHPNVNMYRPGSVTRPAFCHVILLTTDDFSFQGCNRHPAPTSIGLNAGLEQFTCSHLEGVELQSEHRQRQP